MHLDDIQRDNQANEWNRKTGVRYMVIDLGGMCTPLFPPTPQPQKTRLSLNHV